MDSVCFAKKLEIPDQLRVYASGETATLTPDGLVLGNSNGTYTNITPNNCVLQTIQGGDTKIISITTTGITITYNGETNTILWSDLANLRSSIVIQNDFNLNYALPNQSHVTNIYITAGNTQPIIFTLPLEPKDQQEIYIFNHGNETSTLMDGSDVLFTPIGRQMIGCKHANQMWYIWYSTLN